MKDNTDIELSQTQSITCELLTDKEDDDLFPFAANKNEFYVNENNSDLEEHLKIGKIVTLRRNKYKLYFYYLLNILTLFLIRVITEWYPKLLLFIYYEKTTLEHATHVGIYPKDQAEDFEIKEIESVELPSLYNCTENRSVIENFHLNIPICNNIFMFKYKLTPYFYNIKNGLFEAVNYHIVETQKTFIETFANGLNNTEMNFMQLIFGKCDLTVEIENIFNILVEELEKPEYICSLFIFSLWFYQEYNLSYIIFIITLLSLITDVIEEKKYYKTLNQISKYSCNINVYRRDKFNELIPKIINSIDLVPGDLYEIPDSEQILPCDTILISGSVIVDESVITGYSSPVNKTAMHVTSDIFDSNKNIDEHFLLYAGTKIIEKRSLKKQKVLGIVYKTGYNTLKGKLLFAILYPKNSVRKFESDSLKYCISLFALSVILFIFPLSTIIHTYPISEVIQCFFDILTSSVPISLAACIKIGITHSLARLKQKNIYCTTREAMLSVGSLNMIVFDKTGTLTEEKVRVKGYLPINKDLVSDKFIFSQFISDAKTLSHKVVTHYKKKKNVPSYNDLNKDFKQLFVECLATCHSLMKVKNKLIGESEDIEMFNDIGWILDENNSDNKNEGAYDPLVQSYVRPKTEKKLNIPIINLDLIDEEDLKNTDVDINKIKLYYELGIIKRFDFSHKLQRVTVLTKNLNDNYYKIFSKGSPEKIREVCNKDTIPSDFDEVLSYYTQKGYRVFAMAVKCIKLNGRQLLQIQREKIENKMIFLGFVIIENELKEDTKKTIEELDGADYRMVMATGDNMFTSISVAKKCGLVREYQEIFCCDIQKNNDNDEEILSWKKINKEDDGQLDDFFAYLKYNRLNYKFKNRKRHKRKSKILNKDNQNNLPKNHHNIDFINKKNKNFFNLFPIECPKIIKKSQKQNHPHIDLNIIQPGPFKFKYDDTYSPLNISKNLHFAIAITGSNFEKLSILNKKYLKNKDPNLLDVHHIFRLILKNGIIFTRMSPYHKALLVESLKNEGLKVLMCGDGTNDCPALEKADVGVALSSEEASIASDFISKIPSINCLFYLLREGKCSLSAHIQTFKYTISYSIITFFCDIGTITYNSYITDVQCFFMDVFLIYPLEIFFARTKPSEELTYKYPLDDLLSFPILVSIIGQSFISMIFIYGGRFFLKNRFKWNFECGFTEDDDVKPCPDNTIDYIICQFQLFSSAISCYETKLFRRPIISNKLLIIYFFIGIFYTTWLTINCDRWSKKMFNIFDFTEDYEEDNKDIDSGIFNNFKYYLLAICLINMFVTIFYEWGIVRYLELLWLKKKRENDLNQINDCEKKKNQENEIEISKYVRVYYYQRRIQKLIEEKEFEKEFRLDIKKDYGANTEIELVNVKNNEEKDIRI